MATIEGGSLLARRDAIARDYRVAFSMGPIERGDTSAGLYNRVWRVHEDAGSVYVARANDDNSAFEAPALLFAYAGAAVEDLDLGFDTNGAAVVAAQRPTGVGGEAEFWLFWFDIRVPGNVFTRVDYGRTPRLILDDPGATLADLLIFYLNDRNQRVEARVQRENYEVAHALPIDRWYDIETGVQVLQSNTASLALEDVARSTDNKLHVIAAFRNVVSGKYQLLIIESTPYPFRLSEDLGVVHRAQALNLIEVIKLLDFNEGFQALHSVSTLTLIELLIQLLISAESLSVTHRVTGLATLELVIRKTIEAEQLRAVHRVSNLLLTVVALRLTLGEETLQTTHRVQSLTLSAA